MALQLGAVLTAFRAANVPDDVAQRAAEELAGYENRFHDLENRMTAGFAEVRLEFVKVDRRFTELEAKIDQISDRFDGKIEQLSDRSDGKIEQLRLSMRSETNLLRWMVTFNLGLTLLILGRLFGVIHG